MILGVSYNLFDGEELLEASIKQIRDSVDFISIVYQKISNYGYKSNDKLEDILHYLLDSKLVDHIEKYEPYLNKSPHFNEINKRNLGLELSKKYGCTHHLSMDTDEFYIKEEFIRAKNLLDDGGFESSACKLFSYYKKPIYRYLEDYYVPFIFEVNRTFVLNSTFPVLVDPTRRVSPIGNAIIFNVDDIVMHHMTYVRLNIAKKLLNSSAKVNFKDINKIVEYYNTWEYPKKILVAGMYDRYYDVDIVNNVFGDILKEY